MPIEQKKLGFVFVKKKGADAFYEAKYFAEFLFKKLDIKLNFTEAGGSLISSEFEPKRTAVIESSKFGNIGYVGEYKKSTQKSLKLPEATAGFEIDLDKILDIKQDSKFAFEPLSNFQTIKRDISLKISKNTNYKQISDAFNQQITKFEDLRISLSPVDIYSPDGEFKNVTLRFTITPMQKTLTGDDIHKIVSELEDVAKQLDAEII